MVLFPMYYHDNQLVGYVSLASYQGSLTLAISDNNLEVKMDTLPEMEVPYDLYINSPVPIVIKQGFPPQPIRIFQRL